MPRWSTRTMLRELREFKKEKSYKGDETLDDVISKLEDEFIEEEMDKALEPSRPKTTEKKTDDGA